jgi:hypothetical protein
LLGISFLYALWHSPVVRSYLTLDDVDFTVLAATSVLEDLVAFCPPARACRDAFSRMTKATIKMCLASTGFGSQVDPRVIDSPAVTISESPYPAVSTYDSNPLDPRNPNFAYALPTEPRRKKPNFDPDLRSLFSEEESAGKTFGERYGLLQQHQMGQQRQAYPSIESTAMLPVEQSDNSVSGAMPLLTNPFVATNNVDPELSTSAGFQQQAPQQPESFGMLSPWSDMEFLDSVSIPEQFNATSAGAPDALGFDNGFGLGWDGSLPTMNWNDGSGSVDLFDGFFFGGGTGAPGPEQF